jgi:hypothetical protein
MDSGDGLTGLPDRPRHYDRAGKPLSLAEWCRLCEDRTYAVVERTALRNGKVVSTVWLGLDHAFGLAGQPVIFETLVFRTPKGGGDVDGTRYHTEEQAKAGHAAFVRKWRYRPNRRVKKRVLAKKVAREREDSRKSMRRVRDCGHFPRYLRQSVASLARRRRR